MRHLILCCVVLIAACKTQKLQTASQYAGRYSVDNKSAIVYVTADKTNMRFTKTATFHPVKYSSQSMQLYHC